MSAAPAKNSHHSRPKPPEPAWTSGNMSAEDAEAEEQDPGHIQVSPAGPAGARQQAAAEQEGQDADGDVDVEDPPPALGAVGQGEDHAADERADGGGDTDGGAEEPEGAARVRRRGTSAG
ncbi:hypothetical protein GCM10011428_61100 [Streptomyces violaceus]